MSKQHTTEPRQTVADATAVLRDLELKRTRLVERGKELPELRRGAAYLAHVEGNARACKTLDAVSEEAAKFDSELAALDDAINEAKNRVLIAQAFEAETADQAKAQQVRELVGAFREAGRELDDACRTLSEMSRVLVSLLGQLHGHGVHSPTYEQLDVFGDAALKTAIMGTPWAKRYRLVAPLERKSFGVLVSGWADMVEARLRNQFGERKDDAA
jgi:hypothetical protein